ncbi:MafI family immunity protein [Streptomyces rubiginosohelvolus]|uniref:MafI family immunity protein n=1 Tax=Streptomyces rubiginosohelvolus TaxID=67362 RepID=UPI0034429D20
MQNSHYRSAIAELLNDSPIRREDVVKNVREFLMVGEYSLAFDTLCGWIYEDDLAISPAYHARLRKVAGDMDAVELVEDLRALITEPG